MTTYILRRLILAVPVILGVTLVTFSFLSLTGDPCTALLGERYTQARCAEIRAQYGLDQPLPVRYGRYLRNLATGNLGRSIITQRPVTRELAQYFPATVELATAAMMLAIFVGVPLGLLAAVRHNSAFDLGSMLLALLGVSMPVFWLGLLLVWAFAFRLGWFPTGGRLDPNTQLQTITHLYVLDAVLTANRTALIDAVRHLVLPALALSSIPAAFIARITRSAMLEVLNQDYIRAARARGIAERILVVRHAFANATLPVITVIGLQTGFLLSGAVLTETIFAWPGMGRWVVSAIPANDVPVVQAGVLTFAIVFVVVNLVVDLSYAWLDPRIRYR